MKSPKKAQTTCLNASFGPKVCFLFILYVILFLPPTTHHVAASPGTLQPPAQPYTPRHHEQPRQRVGGASRREIKQKKGSQAALCFVFGTSPPPSLFLPTEYTYDYSYVYSTHFFLVFFLLCRFRP